MTLRMTPYLCSQLYAPTKHICHSHARTQTHNGTCYTEKAPGGESSRRLEPMAHVEGVWGSGTHCAIEFARMLQE